MEELIQKGKGNEVYNDSRRQETRAITKSKQAKQIETQKNKLLKTQ